MNWQELINRQCKLLVRVPGRQILTFNAKINSVDDKHISFTDSNNKLYIFARSCIMEIEQVKEMI